MALQNGLINAPVVTLIAFREGQRGVTGVANAHNLGEIRRRGFESNHKFMGTVCDKLPDKEKPMVPWNVRQSLTDVFTTLKRTACKSSNSGKNILHYTQKKKRIHNLAE